MSEPSWSKGPPKTVLLATDLSSRCDRAMDRAAELTKAWDTRLIILNVIEPEHTWTERRAFDLPSWRRPADREALAAAQVQRDLREDLKEVDVRVVEGEPAATIEEIAEEVGAELIIIGIARDETLGRYFLGATVDRLARRIPVPLLVVKSRLRPYREVLVATDFSNSSLHALTAAARFFQTSALTVMHAWEVPFAGLLDTPSVREEWIAMEQKSSDKFVADAQLSPDQRRSLSVLMEHGRPEVMVRAYMHDKGVDVVVVGTHGSGGVFDIRLGGTAKRILEFAPGDVLLIPEPRAVMERKLT